MNWYRINYDRLVMLLLPIALRKTAFVIFLRSFVFQINSLYVSFLSHRQDVQYKLNHNSQVCYLQAVLNDSFDFVQRRIYITDAEQDSWSKLLWKEEFDQPIMLGVFTLQSDRFIGVDGIDFIVHVPYGLSLSFDEEARMNSLLRYYKLAGKRYIIRYYY